jgi:hypothetical protein
VQGSAPQRPAFRNQSREARIHFHHRVRAQWGLLVLVILLAGVDSSSMALAESLELRISETAGIRRFVYPVTVQVTLPEGWSLDEGLRLKQGTESISAQFSAIGADRREILVDFHVSCLPYQEQRYQLVKEESGEQALAVRRRILASPVEGGLVVDAAGVLQYRVTNDLAGLVNSVKIGDDEWLTFDSPGWILETRAGETVRLGSELFPIRSLKVARQGSHVCQLAFTAEGAEGVWKSIRCNGSMTFPLGKSWFEVDCQWEDPEDRLAVSRWELDLRLNEPPLLVDFSAGELVYLTLRSGEETQLQESRSASARGTAAVAGTWTVVHGASDRILPLATGSSVPCPSGIWAHLMDRELCTAIALRPTDAGTTVDSIQLLASGRSVVRRQFLGEDSSEPARTNKQKRGWYHFVYFPPHISAATSPQSMLNPLEVDVVKK